MFFSYKFSATPNFHTNELVIVYNFGAENYIFSVCLIHINKFCLIKPKNTNYSDTKFLVFYNFKFWFRLIISAVSKIFKATEHKQIPFILWNLISNYMMKNTAIYTYKVLGELGA